MVNLTCRQITDCGYKHVSSIITGDVYRGFLQCRRANSRIYLQTDDGRFLQNTSQPQSQ